LALYGKAMHFRIAQHFLLAFIFFLQSINSKAQFQTIRYFDAGQNVVSDGFYLKMGTFANYQFGKNNVAAGLQTNIISNNDKVLSGYSIKATRELMISSFPMEIQGLFILSPFSDLIKETNWGILFGTHRNHFAIRIGTNFRTYSYTQKTFEDYDFETNTRIHENWNPMYSFDYYINSIDHRWNIGLAITNIDHFIINQDTNPVFNLQFTYRSGPSMNMFIESWYKTAGALNLNVNYFGYFFRAGITWDIHLKQLIRRS
jgi:hypothetical protein